MPGSSIKNEVEASDQSTLPGCAIALWHSNSLARTLPQHPQASMAIR
jgi:hypothetical protein